MKSVMRIEVETKNLKQFVPEEGSIAKDYTKKELKECNENVESEFHSAIKGTLKEIFRERKRNHAFFDKMRDRIIDSIEEVLIDDSSAYELPEIDSLSDIGELSFKVLDK